MADYNINAVTRRVVFTGSAGLGPYAFTFEVLDQNDLAVYLNTTLLTLTTDYTVTINANGTGSVTLVTGGSVSTAPTASDTIVILGARDIERTTDFVTAGDLLASSLNEQLDSNIIFEQQIDERVDRSIKFPPYDSFTGDNELPAAAARADKLLKFDTSGNPEMISASSIIANTIVGANYTNDTFTGTGSQTAFTLSAAPGSKNNCQVYIDGVYQEKASFTLNDTALTFTEAPPTSASIEVIVGNAVEEFSSTAVAVTTDDAAGHYTATNVEATLQEIGGVVFAKNSAGAGITSGTGTVYKAGASRGGDIIVTRIFIDLTGLNSGNGAGDIIGVDGTTSACHIGQITAATNGTIFWGKMTCIETPAGGDTDIDLYAADEGTGIEDGAIADLTETQLINAGTASAGNEDLVSAVPSANQYLYLVGQGTANATYTAGQFLVELYGYA
jgi:hypothetical protein